MCVNILPFHSFASFYNEKSAENKHTEIICAPFVNHQLYYFQLSGQEHQSFVFISRTLL